MRRALVAVALAAPFAARAQVVLTRARAEGFDGTVVGRVCLDEDGDGRCGEANPGVPGAEVLLDTGQRARADAQGRFHFVGVPSRAVQALADGNGALDPRTGYGVHVLSLDPAVAGHALRRLFELAPGGAAQVDVAVPPPPPLDFPALEVAPPAGAPAFEGAKLRWPLSLRAPAGARVWVAGAPAAIAGGVATAPVELSPHENEIAVRVDLPSGAIALFAQTVFLAPRAQGGALVVPRTPEPLAIFRLPPEGETRPGEALAVDGRAAPGVVPLVAGAAAPVGRGGRFFAVAGPGTLALAARRGALTAAASREVRLGAPSVAVAGLGDAELVALGKSPLVVAGRAAVAAAGSWRSVRGEAGLDLDDGDRSARALLAPRDLASQEALADPARTFLATGDAAAQGDANAPRGRLWLHLRTASSALDAGAIRSGLTAGEVGRYDRALYGAKLSGVTRVGPVALSGAAFAAQGDADPSGLALRPAHDALAGAGGSVYWLSHRDVARGSEALRVELHDPLTGLLVGQVALTPHVDYDLDGPTGRVLLAAPLGSFAAAGQSALLAGDPTRQPVATLVADYSYLAVNSAHDDAFGGRAGAAAGPLAVSASGAAEERVGGSYRLGAARARLDLGAPLEVELEAARSVGDAFAGGDFTRSLSGGLDGAAATSSASSGNALHAVARGAAAGVSYAAWWRERSAGFSDGSHLEATDSVERGAQLAVGSEDSRASGGASYSERRYGDRFEPGIAGATGLRFGEAHASARLGDARLTAQGFDEAAELPSRDAPRKGDQLAAGLEARYALTPHLEILAAHTQTISNHSALPDETFSSVGARVEGRDGALTARGGWGPGLGPRVALSGEWRGPEATYGDVAFDPMGTPLSRERISTIGTRRTEGAVTIFSEDQFGRDLFGLRAGRAAGVSLAPGGGLILSARAERGERLTDSGGYFARTAAGASASWVAGPLMLAGRAEAREDGALAQAVKMATLGGAASLRATDRLTFAARGDWTHAFIGPASVVYGEGALSAAWRGDRAAALAQVARVTDAPPLRVEDLARAPRSDTDLAHLVVTADLASRLTLGLGAHAGRTHTAQGDSSGLSGSVRPAVRVLGPLDLAVEYALLRQQTTASTQLLHSARIEVGWRQAMGRVAVGYNLFGFSGTGVAPNEEQAGRLFVKIELAPGTL